MDLDIEKLKLVIDAVQQMGGDAKEFGIVYLLAATVPSLIGDFLFFAGVVFALLVARKLILGVINSCNLETEQKSMEINLVSMIGLELYPPLTRSERKRVMDHIQILVDKERNATKKA